MMLPACKGTGKRQAPQGNTSTSGTVVMACDASFENVMQQEIEVFEYVYPNAAVLPYYIDEKACIDSLLFGSARLAVTSHELSTDQVKYLRGKKRVAKSKKIAVDAVAIIVNPDNPVENLSVQDLQEILTGKITDWNDVYPSKLGKIQVVFDHSGSSVAKYVTDSVLNGAKYASNVYSAESMTGVFDAVKERKNAIGLVGVSWISADLKSADLTAEERVKNLEVDDTTATSFVKDVKVLGVRRNNSLVAYKPYQAYIFDGSYPLFRSIYMINTGAAGSLANGVFAFVTSFRGQKLMMSTGVLPATVHHRMVSVE
jgi:phosphate transport system substrate-binding protein